MKIRHAWGSLKGIIYVIFLAAMVGCAGMGAPRENLRFSAKMQPKFMQGFPEKGIELTRFVLTGESINKWTEALETINTLRTNYPPTIDSYIKSKMELRKKSCPDSVFNIIKQDADSILYEVRTANCPPYPDEHSVTRTLYGKTNVWTLIYTNKIKEMPPDKREEWIGYLSRATIETIN